MNCNIFEGSNAFMRRNAGIEFIGVAFLPPWAHHQALTVAPVPSPMVILRSFLTGTGMSMGVPKKLRYPNPISTHQVDPIFRPSKNLQQTKNSLAYDRFTR